MKTKQRTNYIYNKYETVNMIKSIKKCKINERGGAYCFAAA